MVAKLPDLSGFSGSETIYRHALNPRVRYTEGVQFLAKEAECYWLIDKIAALQHDRKIRAAEFQVWRIFIAGNKAKIVVEDGNGIILYTEDVDYTDLPDSRFDIWVTDSTILLPSEY